MGDLVMPLALAAAATAVAALMLVSAYLNLHRRHRAMRRQLDRVSHEKHVLENRLGMHIVARREIPR